MKHIINNPKLLVVDALRGLAFTNPGLEVEGTSIFLKDVTPRIHLLAGGGAGHEPHAIVGKGLLSAAVCGQVFASPNANQVSAALERLTSGGAKGILVITKQYTGDVIQFGLATEKFSAAHVGKDIARMIVVGDDVAVPRSQVKLTGRRGLAGTALVYKIAGALAVEGASLDEVEHIATIVSENCGTVGMGLEHCHVPGTAAPKTSHLKADEMELGMGIHNEPGIMKLSPVPSAEKLIDQMLEMIINVEDKERGFVPFKGDGKDSVILCVNNLGGLPAIELSLIVQEASTWLAKKNITVERVVSGLLVSSLNLPGFSLTLCLLPRSPVVPSNFKSKLSFDSDLIIKCFDAPTESGAWPWTYKGRPTLAVASQVAELKDTAPKVVGPAPSDPKKFLAMLKAAVESVVAAEPDITHFDTVAGDGDAGLTLKVGGEAILEKLSVDAISSQDVVAAVVTISAVISKEMGGTAGGLYAIFTSALAGSLIEAALAQDSKIATAQVWSEALELALNSLYNYTLARAPSRTLIDPLAAFVSTFSSNPNDFEAAYLAAKEATEATRTLVATAGRAAYVDQKDLANANVPDAGAWGFLQFVEGIRSAL